MSLEPGQDDSGAGQERVGPGHGGQEHGESASVGTASADPKPPDLDLRRLAQDWITLWESELSALAADPEMREAWQSMASVWAGAMAAMLRAMPRGSAAYPGPWPFASGHTPAGHASPGHAPSPQSPAADDRPPRNAGPYEPPWAAPAAAAPDPRDTEIDRLARHIDALERRLAEVERGGGVGRDAPRRRPRKPRPAE